MKVLLIITILGLLFLGPVATVATLDVLFGLGIELTLGSYLAAMWLHMLVGAVKLNNKK